MELCVVEEAESLGFKRSYIDKLRRDEPLTQRENRRQCREGLTNQRGKDVLKSGSCPEGHFSIIITQETPEGQSVRDGQQRTAADNSIKSNEA